MARPAFRKCLASVLVLVAVMSGALAPAFASKARPSVYETVLEEPGQRTPEVSTDELRKMLAKRSGVVVFDARPKEEYALAHIPGSLSLDEKGPLRVAQAFPDPATTIVLYSNGPYCDLARLRADELVKLGYSRVSRYQLGLPVWRALGGAVETNLAGFRHLLYENDVVVIDARRRAEYAAGTIPAAESILAGEVSRAKEDRRLRYYDAAKRIVVFANSGIEARAVAEEIARNAYPNASYFGGSYNDLKRARFFVERIPSPSYLDGLNQ